MIYGVPRSADDGDRGDNVVREGRSLPAQPRYVVGIGASAGGLEALEAFFDNLPDGLGMAFVVVQHLSPDFKSMMDELLARHTRLPIRLVEDGMPVEPDHIYLIPPRKEMIIAGGRLLLSEKERQQEFPLPIDMFFRSLAQDCGPRSVAIVLSGGGSDGSRGVRDVHDAGGLVIVQDVDTAQFEGMPKTAFDAGVADFVLSPQDMPRAIVCHAQQTARQRPPEAKQDGGPAGGLAAIYEMLEREFGLDFTLYKPSTTTRRIERRLALARSRDIEEYVERLRSERHELDVLYRDLLIGVTRFFRNEAAFTVMEERILPELWRRGPTDAPIRVWVAGCATGEEAYSLAILLHEASRRLGERPVKIFATDVHRGSLDRASRGMYDEEAVSHVSPERLKRYFLRSGASYQLVPDVRQLVVFASHNVIKDAPFTRVDLVSCRNLLIYLQPAAQQKALALFHFALNRGGILFLGPSESPGHLAHDFESIDNHWRVYRKFSDARIPVDSRLQPSRAALGATSAAPQPTRYSLLQLLGAYDTLLDKYMPPSLLVTDRGELVHSFGGASRFLATHDGRQGLDIVEFVDPELRPLLAAGLRRALAESKAIAFRGVHLAPAGEAGTYKISICRVPSKTGGTTHALIAFERMDAAGAIASSGASGEAEIVLDRTSRDQIGAIQAELLATKENLQSAIEELQTSNEELQAANEELLASNEELQSTNEELQSVNEELYTVNAEYQRKIRELTEVTNDMDNLLASTDVGAIFLDTELRVRRFTPQIAETFRLVVHDIGRPIDTFAHTLRHPELAHDLKKCIATGERIERELRDLQGKYFFLRVLPYRAKGTVEGVVLTLIDATGLKAAEDALFHERYLLDSLLCSVPDAIYFRDARGRFIRANDVMGRRLGLPDGRSAAEKSAFELLDERPARALVAADDVVLQTGDAQVESLERRAVGAQEADAWDLVTRLPLKNRDGEVVGVIGLLRDVTPQKQAEQKLQEEVRRRDQFLAMLSHELRNPLNAIVTAIELMKSDAKGGAEKRARVIGVLDRQSSQMARLLDDLLEASRVTQNRIELRKKTIDLRVSVKESADAVRPTMEARGIGFTVAVEDSPLHVDGDPARLEQIHTNLLNNAMKYTPRGGHVALQASREGDHAVVRVRDDGVGIPKQLLESVFELFVQSRQTLDRSEGGLGLGLSVVRSLVAMHGGDVAAYSDGEHQGSEFVVRLPLADAPALESDEALVHLRRPPGRGARVAVVEDNADSRQVLCELLELLGYECRAADNGAAGLALIDEMRPQLAIVDLGLPGLDGLQLARRVRSDPKHAEVYLIALTGYGQPADRAATREAGFDEHLVKPVRTEQLLTRLSLHTSAQPHVEIN